MLRLVNVTKNYKVADSEVLALKGINLNFRKNEFVSILGPSGCGKTTMLNIIGGLDKYTTGDLFIGGVSTKNFKDHDWDVYRNHKIGFVFQSYNLIPHQTILGNVELALTISGMGKKERQERAKRALDKVGLKGQYNKKPNQLSGGQCQRVAIARALVNEPSILLADEPTGALDTTTSEQIMELIKEISKEKLVIMVTHNPDIAKRYSTRIVRLLDGELQKDSKPFSTEEEETECKAERETIPTEEERKKDKAKMNLWTAFKLSGRNLISKAKRTLMVALAGCIGIVGISAVISVSNGVQGYVDSMENDMLSGNPVYISQSAIDYGTLMGGGNQSSNVDPVNPDNDIASIYVNSTVQRLYNMSGVMTTNTITKEYMDYLKKMPEENCALVQYEYGYKIAPNLYTGFRTSDGKTHRMSIAAIQATYSSVLKNLEDMSQYSSMISTATVMTELPSNAEYLASQYDIIYLEDGMTFEEVIGDKSALIAVAGKSHNTLNDLELAEYGYFSQEQFMNYCYKISGDERYVASELMDIPKSISYETLAAKKFEWYPNDTVFKQGTGSDEFGDKFYVSAYSDGSLSSETDEAYSNYKFNAFGNVDGRVEMNVKCVLKLKEELSYGCLSSGGLYYTGAMSEHARKYNYDSAICTSARNNGGELYNIEMGYNFKVDGDTNTELDTYFLSSGGDSIMSYISAFFGSSGGKKTVTSYSGSALGSDEFPSSIYFYCNNFDQKDKLTAYLDVWNNTVAANAYKTDDNGFYVGKEKVDGVERTVYYYLDRSSGNYYKVNLSKDGFALDYKGNQYRLEVDKENNDSGFYQKNADVLGNAFTLDGTIKVNDQISVNAYTLASYIIFGKEFQESNIFYKDIEKVSDSNEELYRYKNADEQYEYVMKVKNQSYYKLSLDKDGYVMATQSGYGKYRYNEEDNLFYLDEYEEIKTVPGGGEGEEETKYRLKSTALSKEEQKNIYADQTVYQYANVVKNPQYTFVGEDSEYTYTFNTFGLYVDMTQAYSKLTADNIKSMKNNVIILKDYSGIDFYYLDADDNGEKFYYVNYAEEDGVSYIYGNNASSYLSATSLSGSGYNVEGFVSDKYQYDLDGGEFKAVTPHFSDTALTIDQLLKLRVIGEKLTDISVLEKDTSLKITYTDNIGLIIAMVNTLIDIVTYALIAFTALSLLVSTVMIGIITYVSVVERTKEIGVIRSLGGRKRDVSHLFNAETFIIGLVAGLFGIAITYVICAIINAVIGHLTGIYTIATFPIWQAAIMVGLSIALTLLSGILPSRSAAKKDPVVALRTE